MKTITVTMTDDVYRDVLDNAMVRRMVGEGHGIMDMAMLKILGHRGPSLQERQER
jgi:hypothetical protein